MKSIAMFIIKSTPPIQRNLIKLKRKIKEYISRILKNSISISAYE